MSHHPASVVVYVGGGSSSDTACAVVPMSSGKNSGERSGSRAAILRQFRDQAPARWMAFLHAHFSGSTEVSAFFDVDEKTGRNWWNGVGRPSVDKTMYAQVIYPDAFTRYMLAAE